MKLVTEMYAQAPGGGQGSLAGTKLTQAANNKASQAAQAPKATTNTGNNIGMQAKQMSQKTGNVMAPNVQKPGGAPAKQATTAGPQNVISHYDYFHALRARKEFIKQLDETKSDWKKELTEALGADDEVFHPYVEVMPFKNFKQNEAKKNLAQQAGKQGAAENPAQVKAKAGLMGMGEEVLKERAMPPHGDERKKREKEEKMAMAQKAKDAARHARVTKGIPFSDAKGKGYLKNGKKIYEGLEQEFSKEKQRRSDEARELANREKKDKDRIARRREMVDYTDYDGKYKGKKTSRNLGKANEKSD